MNGEQQPDHPKRPYASALEAEAEEQEQVSPATRSQKRQIGSNGDDNERQLKRSRLTRKNLALFDKVGRKKVSDSTDESGSTKTTSTTTSGFAIQACKNGILPPFHSKLPTNFKEIRERYAGSRKTASPTESAYNDFVDKVERADNEATMVFEVGAHMLKTYPKGYKRTFNQQFTGFPKNVGFNNSLSAPQPDFVEGLGIDDYLPFPIDEHVSGAALYKDNPYSMTLPHLAGEWKGPDGNIEARLQSAYDGAALVYARSQALAYMGSSDPPGHAEITTFTTDGTNLNLYAHYAMPSEDDKNKLEYHQYQFASANIKDTQQGHNDGRRGLRNTQDHAKDQSYALRDELKEHWKQRRSTLPSITQGTPLPTTVLEPTDAYEETAQYGDEAGVAAIASWMEGHEGQM